jgi:hypothetical protein
MFGAFWRAIRQRSGVGKLNLHKEPGRALMSWERMP